MPEMVNMVTGMGYIGTEPGVYRMAPPYTYEEAEGEVIAVDSKAGRFKGLRVMGRTEQFTTTGAQLLDTSKLTTRYSTADIAENGRVVTITGKGAYSGLVVNHSDISMFNNLIGKDTFISAKFRGNSLGASILIALSYKTQDNNTVKYLSVSSNLSEGAMFLSRSIPEDAILSTLQININHSDTELDKEQTVIFEDLIIGVGTTALPWEPYTGGIPSPNPDYPQDLVSVGDGGSVDVEVRGGNLLKVNCTSSNGLTATYNDDGSITVSGTATTNWSNISLTSYKCYIPKGKYIFSITEPVDVVVGIKHDRTFALDAESFSTYRILAGNTNVEYERLYDSHFLSIFLEKTNIGTEYNFTLKPMLRRAEISDDTFEPYKHQSITIATPNGLPGIPVTDASIANYTDANGQMWCCDEVDLERGVYVQRLLLYKLSSGDIWYHSSSTKQFYSRKTELICSKTDSDYYPFAFCTHFKPCGHVPGGSFPDLSFGFINNTSPGFAFKHDALNGSVTAWKSFLDENDIYVLGILATPIETPLSAAELAAYRALRSNKPVTTIFNDANAYMKVKYRR